MISTVLLSNSTALFASARKNFKGVFCEWSCTNQCALYQLAQNLECRSRVDSKIQKESLCHWSHTAHLCQLSLRVVAKKRSKVLRVLFGYLGNENQRVVLQQSQNLKGLYMSGCKLKRGFSIICRKFQRTVCWLVANYIGLFMSCRQVSRTVYDGPQIVLSALCNSNMCSVSR